MNVVLPLKENYSVHNSNFLVGDSIQGIFEFFFQCEDSMLVARDFRTREGTIMDNSIKTIMCQYMSKRQCTSETISPYLAATLVVRKQ